MAGNRTPEQESPRNNNLQRPDMEPQLPAQGPLQPRMIEEEEQQPGEERMQLRQDSRKLSPQQQLSQQLQQHIPDTPQYRIIQKLRSRVPDTPQQKIIQKLQSGIRDTQGQDSPQQQQDAASSKGDGPAGAPSTAPPPKQNSGGGQDLPQPLQSGMERLSGLSMADIRVHYDSEQPGFFGAHSFAQGRDIHLGPGRGDDLPHEAWHTVQQKQGRVPITRQFRDTGINDDPGLEREADVMGEKALQMKVSNDVQPLAEEPLSKAADSGPLQKKDAGTESATDTATATDSGGFTEGLIIQSGSLRLYSSLGQLNKGLADRSYYGGILVDMPPGTKLLVYNSTINDAKKRVKAYVNGKEYDGFCSGHPSEVRLLSSPEEKKKQEAETEERIRETTTSAKKSTKKGITFDSGKKDYVDFINGLGGFGAGGVVTTGSIGLGMEISFAALGTVLWGVLETEIGGKLGLKGNINVQDDRRLRVTGAIKIASYAKGSVLWDLVKLEGEKFLEVSLTGVYESPEHLAAIMYNGVMSVLANLYEILEKHHIKAPSSISDSPDKQKASQSDIKRYKEVVLVAGAADGESVSVETSAKASKIIGAGIKIEGGGKRSAYRPYTDTKRKGKKATNTEKFFKVTVDLGRGGLELSATYNDINNDPNPDNNGQYLNLKAFIYGNFEVSYEEFSLLINGMPLPKGAFNIDTLEKMANFLAKGLRKSVKPSTKLSRYDLGANRKGGSVMEFNLVNVGSREKSDYALQYFRTSLRTEVNYNTESDFTSGGGAGGVGVRAGVDIDGELEFGLLEILGNGTLTYISTVYNGLMNRRGGQKDWNAYKVLHFVGIRDIAIRLGNPQSNVRKEYTAQGISAGSYLTLCEKAYQQYKKGSLENGLAVQLVEGMESYVLPVMRTNTKKGAF